MKYVFDKNGIIDSENTERLVQYSVSANELQVAFTDLNIKEYVPYVAFERADGKVSPLIGMAFTEFELNDIKYAGASYSFSDSWVTAVSGVLKVAIILKKNNVNARTSTFNLNIAESVSEDRINYIDDVAYNELNARLFELEKNFENGFVESAEKDSLGNVINEHYATKEELTQNEANSTNYTNTKVNELNANLIENYATKEALQYLNNQKASYDYVNNKIPTKTSQLTNDSDYVNTTVNNLVNYYLKAETYTRQEVLDLVNSIPKFAIQVVDTLPSSNISKSTIYLLNIQSDDLTNIHEEYIYTNENRWELIGTTKIDLSDYAKISQLPTKLSELINDTNYLTNIIKDTNPTSAINGQWVFNGNSVIAKEFSTSVEAIDSKGNTFTTIATMIDYDSSYKINGISSDGVIQTIYSVYYKNGLAYIDGELDKDYYIEFASASDDIGLVEILNSCCYKYKPTIPTKTSELVNDSGFIKAEDVVVSSAKINATDFKNTLITGKWAFYKKYDTIDTTSQPNGEYEVNFTDSDGKIFNKIIFKHYFNTDDTYAYSSIEGTYPTPSLETGSGALIYNGSKNTGMAFKNGELRSDYYLTFEFTTLSSQIVNQIRPVMIKVVETDTKDVVLPTKEYADELNKETKAYVDKRVADLVNSAPETLDTLGELAQALGENDNVVEALNKAITNKVDKVSGKGLSTNDYTNAEKTKLAGLQNYDDTELRKKIDSIEPDAIIDVSSVDELGSTPVAISGRIGKVYLNTKLSHDEVVEICKGLNYLEYDDVTLCPIFSDSTLSNSLFVNKIFDSDFEIYEYLIVYKNGDNDDLICFGGLDYKYDDIPDDLKSQVGWQSGFNGVIEINNESAVSTLAPMFNFTPVNDKVTNLFSSTPFANEKVLYRVGGGFSGTIVPNTGYVEKVYFNDKLSAEEVYNILSQLTYVEIPISDALVYPILFANDGNPVVFITKSIGDVSGFTYYNIFSATDITNSETAINVLRIDYPNDILIVEFNYTEYTINKEVINDYSGLSVGTQNNLISSLVSSTPFTETTPKLYHIKNNVKYEIASKTNAIIDVKELPVENIDNQVLYRIEPKNNWQGTTVPNGEYVGNVYLNINLSVDEVMAFLTQLDYSLFGNTNAFIRNSNNTKMLCAYISSTNNVYTIRNYYTNEFYFVDKVGLSTVDFVGWNPEFNGIIEFNDNAAELTTQNELIKNLVSITPFVKESLKLYHFKNGDKYELVSKDDLDKTIGDIEAILDQLNGEVV